MIFRKLIFLIPIYGILILSNPVYSNTLALTSEQAKELEECENDGYDDGQNDDFDHGKDRECLALNEDIEEGPGSVEFSTYYHNWIRGRVDAGNTRDTCELFTDQ
ncbi:MAG TPA: hypothetical protein VE130_03835 [Nitrososphaeraceae archaeon]|nr:hypothetical protein [Nitrososphaeraceae archaeon]